MNKLLSYKAALPDTTLTASSNSCTSIVVDYFLISIVVEFKFLSFFGSLLGSKVYKS